MGLMLGHSGWQVFPPGAVQGSWVWGRRGCGGGRRKREGGKCETRRGERGGYEAVMAEHSGVVKVHGTSLGRWGSPLVSQTLSREAHACRSPFSQGAHEAHSPRAPPMKCHARKRPESTAAGPAGDDQKRAEAAVLSHEKGRFSYLPPLQGGHIAHKKHKHLNAATEWRQLASGPPPPFALHTRISSAVDSGVGIGPLTTFCGLGIWT